MQSAQILSKFPIVDSSDNAAMIAALNELYHPSEVREYGDNSNAGHHVLRGFCDEGYAIGYIHSGLGVSLSGANNNSYFVNIGVSGELLSSRGVDWVRNDKRHAVIFNPGDRQTLVPKQSRAQTIGIRLGRNLVDAELEKILGRELDGPVRFDFAMDLTSPHAEGIRLLLKDMLRLFDASPLLVQHAAIRKAQIRMFITGLLLTQHHNFTEALESGASPYRPRNLTRALAYIEEHLVEPISLQDIAAAVGCSSRTISSVFRENLGISPMHFVRDRRLELVHSRIMNNPDDSVSQAAQEAGFAHLGRFANAYHSRFGELPSATKERN